MDVQKKLDEIVDTVAGARSMPMSASCVVNRAELLALLEEVRQALPGSLAQAQELIGGRDQMVEQARQEAERIIESAHAQRGSLISDTEVARRSQGEADRILAEARREAEEIRAEADDYVDSKLANFEVVLTKTIGSVDRGREKLLGRGPGLSGQGAAYGDSPDGFPDPDAPEGSHDPQTLRRQADEYVDAKLGAFEAVLSKTLEAVGRGRQKLVGRVATDELREHIAAQDAAEGRPGATSDADFLAGLAEPAAPVAAIPAQAAPAEPGWDGRQDPYATGGYAAAYGGQDASYAYQQPDPYQQQYQQQPDPYGYQPDPYGYQQQPAPQADGRQAPGAALDETSLFDTSVIDLDQFRQYEQGR
ncbi:DivIVA domain-containing protein [Streptomyces sp. NPDC101132]|uniref:DivIVA domain-containing protein n=1 Tax=Streptomyces sp. NPDC101132 TaxID=3366110 RepID=UPI003822C581